MCPTTATPKPTRMDQASVLFSTPIGACSLRWYRDRITDVSVHGDDSRAPTVKGTNPPLWVQEVIDQIRRHLAGDPQRFSGCRLAFDGISPFCRNVYRAARSVPPGRTISYGELAARAGRPGAARAVGQAMRTNPFHIIVPCHRVLPVSGRLGAYSAGTGPATKARLLALEGAWPNGQAFPTNGKESGLAFDAGTARAQLLWLDPAFRRVIAEAGPIPVPPSKHTTPFVGLFEAIVYQQLTDKAAGTILRRVLELFRPRRFPTPHDIREVSLERLRGAGLSRNKSAAVKDLAERTLDGNVPSRRVLECMSDEDIIERLSGVRGIGRWTVQMLLIFRMGRPDVLPADDLGVRKGFARVFGTPELPAPADILGYGERWRPYRSAASWYLWRAVDLLA